jgi:serine/threonine protein phosphatase PrpC
VPIAGEVESGDGWSHVRDSHRVRLLVADGLGHGPAAAIAAREAVQTFDALPEARPAESVERMHMALRATRGASVAVAELDEERGLVHFCGVGNISCTVILGNESRHLVSHNGTAGHEVRRIQEFEAEWATGSLIILASDGLSTRWDLDAYPGIIRHHPAVVAGVLFRDFRRDRDDVTVVAGRKGAALSMVGGVA